MMIKIAVVLLIGSITLISVFIGGLLEKHFKVLEKIEELEAEENDE